MQIWKHHSPLDASVDSEGELTDIGVRQFKECVGGGACSCVQHGQITCNYIDHLCINQI